MFTNEADTLTPKARIVDGALILSLSNALSPIVWRMGLDQLEEAAFQLVEDKGEYLLVVHSKGGNVRDIARYATKEDGQRALLLATDALMSGENYITAGGSDKSMLRSFAEFPVANLMRWLLFFILLLIMLFIMMWLFTPPQNIPMETMQQMQQSEQMTGTQSRPAATPEQELQAGEAVDVDELFNQ